MNFAPITSARFQIVRSRRPGWFFESNSVNVGGMFAAKGTERRTPALEMSTIVHSRVANPPSSRIHPGEFKARRGDWPRSPRASPTSRRESPNFTAISLDFRQATRQVRDRGAGRHHIFYEAQDTTIRTLLTPNPERLILLLGSLSGLEKASAAEKMTRSFGAGGHHPTRKNAIRKHQGG